LATPGKVGRVLIKSSASAVTFTDEAMGASAGYKRYTITDSTKAYWDKDTAIVVEVDDVVATSGYSIEYPGGVIVFDSVQDSDAVITVSGKYVVVEQLAGFFNWSLTVNNTTIDATTFTSGEWSEFALATKNWEATAEKFWASTDDFSQRMGEEVIVVLYCDFGTDKTRFEGYAVIQSDEASTPVNELINDSISFKGFNGIYFRNGFDPVQLLISDSFDRANNASSLGNTDTGQTWTTFTGVPRIISNQASATTGIYRGYIETGITDCVLSAKIVDVDSSGAALMFRIADVNNRYYVGVYPASLIFGKFVAGVQTAISTITLDFVEDEIVKVIVNGTSIKVYVNDTLQVDTTDSDLATGTKCGIGMGTSDDYLDDFKIEAI